MKSSSMVVRGVLFLVALVLSGAAFAREPIQVQFGEILVSCDKMDMIPMIAV